MDPALDTTKLNRSGDIGEMDGPNVVRYTRLEMDDPLLETIAQITKNCTNKQPKPGGGAQIT